MIFKSLSDLFEAVPREVRPRMWDPSDYVLNHYAVPLIYLPQSLYEALLFIPFIGEFIQAHRSNSFNISQRMGVTRVKCNLFVPGSHTWVFLHSILLPFHNIKHIGSHFQKVGERL